MKRLNVEKVVPCIEDYIRNAYQTSGLADQNKQLCVHGTVSIRDMVCAVLCARAIGSENVQFYAHGSFSRNHPFYFIDLKHLEIFPEHYLTFKKLVIPQKDLNNWITDKVVKIKMTIERIDHRTPYITDKYNIFHHLESMYRAEADRQLSVASTNFGYQAILQVAEDTCSEIVDKFGSGKTENVIYPLYWFSDDEVYQIGNMLGICGVWSEYPFVDFSFQYRDTPCDRAIKYALMKSYDLEYFNRYEVFKNKMLQIPSCKHISDTLTYFLMGGCYGCYEEM